ncbi:MAG TPA: adenylosuccinate synthetase, partial [Bacteroidales bacterium]|nr:adenylosuccinate synthetase [Bacteroidales bacterium]
ALNYAIMLSGVNELVMMKADVMDELETIKVAMAYDHNGQTIDHIPFEACNQTLVPQYIEMPGWKKTIRTLSSSENMPEAFENYIHFIESHTKVPIRIVSTGPDRSETLYRSRK